MRGKAQRIFARLLVQGITPARAGKSRRGGAPTFGNGDHPRACGEKTKKQAEKERNPGSPPRVRGKVYRAVLLVAFVGITPARAGKRLRCSSCNCPLWDHPRACGEKILLLLLVRWGLGSPPRVRGKGGHCPHSFSGVRITPARAGKSPASP